MLQAIVRGKAPADTENSEDVLTSCVFGPLEYGVEDTYLVQFLGQAKDLDGNLLLEDASSWHVQSVELWRWIFPQDGKRAQPDVIVTLSGSNGLKLTLLVECKLWSPKSSQADGGDLPMDQLARELLALDHMRKVERIANSALVYVTANHKLPRRDFQEAFDELASKGYHTGSRAYWAGWQQLHALLIDCGMLRTKGGKTIGIHLCELLERLGLTSFRSFKWPAPALAQLNYQFVRTRRQFTWSARPYARYVFVRKPRHSRWNWAVAATGIADMSSTGREWRFQ